VLGSSGRFFMPGDIVRGGVSRPRSLRRRDLDHSGAVDGGTDERLVMGSPPT